MPELGKKGVYRNGTCVSIAIPANKVNCEAREGGLGPFADRYRIIEQPALLEAFAVRTIAVGSESFVTRLQSELGIGGSHREIIPDGNGYHLSEPSKSYNDDFGVKMIALTAENSDSQSKNQKGSISCVGLTPLIPLT